LYSQHLFFLLILPFFEIKLETDNPERQLDWAELMDIYGDDKQALSHYKVAADLFKSQQNFFDAMTCVNKGAVFKSPEQNKQTKPNKTINQK